MITAIDHIVLTAADPDKTIGFYCDVMGMELQIFTPPDGTPPPIAPQRIRRGRPCSMRLRC